TNQTRDDAGADRIETERRRDAAFFFDADRRLQRILERAGEVARFLFAHPSAADLSAPTKVLRVDRGRGLHVAVEQNREALVEMVSRELVELFCTLAVEFEVHLPLVLVTGERMRDVIARQIRTAMDEQFLVSFFPIARL